MSNFSNEFARVQLRSAVANAELQPKYNDNATQAMSNIIKVQHFMEPIARLANQGKQVKYWSDLHVPFFHSMYSTLTAMVLGTTLAKARGDGRMSSIVDCTMSIGNGLRARSKGVISFLELENVEWETLSLGTNGGKVSFPVLDQLYRSGQVFNDLSIKLRNRDRKANQILELKGTRMSHSERVRFEADKEFYLVKNAWTRSKIQEASVEFLGRAFAFAMPTDVRENLVLATPGDGMSFGQALDTLHLKSKY